MNLAVIVLLMIFLVLLLECYTPYLATRQCSGKRFPGKWALGQLRSVNSSTRVRFLFPIRKKVLLETRKIWDKKVLIKLNVVMIIGLGRAGKSTVNCKNTLHFRVNFL